MNPNYPSTEPPAGNSLPRSAQEVGRSLKSAATDAAANLKTSAARAARGGKEAAVDRIDGLGHSIDDTARALEEKDPNIAWFAHRAAERVQRVADYLRERDFASLRDDCSDLARRHPAAFFGGLFVAGLVVGNMLKATARTAASHATDNYRAQPGGEDYRAQERGEVSEGRLHDPTFSASGASI